MRQGSSTRLMMFETQSRRMAIAASPGAAEDGVIEEEHHDGAATTQRDPRVARSRWQRSRGKRPSMQQRGAKIKQGTPTSTRNRQADSDGLNAGDRGAFGILFANAARDHGGGGQAEAQADRENQAEQRLGEADGGDGVGAEAADPKTHPRRRRATPAPSQAPWEWREEEWRD